MTVGAKKSLGQNWLVNPHILDKIVAAAEISKDDIILEVGPGTGLLTKKLAEKSGRIIAVEKDPRLISKISQLASQFRNIEIVEKDILKFNPANYKSQDMRYKIVANIPYYITSNLLRKIFEEWPQPKLIVLTVQKEVAQRIVAKPPPKSSKAASGQAHMNLLALSVQYYSEPKVIAYISKNNFRPIPKVDSAIIKLTINDPRPATEESKKLFKLIKMGFSEKRKQLASILAKKLGTRKEKVIETFQKLDIAENTRAENLSLEQWEKLQKLIFY